jgi:Protein of unknown function, DUF481
MKRLFICCIFLSIFSTFLKSQIINIEDKRVKLGDSVATKGYIDVGFNLVQNDKKLITAAGNSLLEHVHFKHLFLLISGYNFVKTGDKKLLNDGFGHLRYNYLLGKNTVLEVYTQAQYNERTRSRFRGLMGTGLRHTVNLTKKQRFYVGLSYMYEHNEFNDITPNQYDHRISSYVSFNINLNEKIRLVSTSYCQPLLTKSSALRFSSQGSFIAYITKRFIYRSTMSLTFDNDTRLPPSVPDFVYTWMNGVRWEF